VFALGRCDVTKSLPCSIAEPVSVRVCVLRYCQACHHLEQCSGHLVSIIRLANNCQCCQLLTLGPPGGVHCDCLHCLLLQQLCHSVEVSLDHKTRARKAGFAIQSAGSTRLALQYPNMWQIRHWDPSLVLGNAWGIWLGLGALQPCRLHQYEPHLAARSCVKHCVQLQSFVPQ